MLVIETSVPSADLDSARRGIRFYTQLLPELKAIPGVVDASASSMVPGHTSSNGSYWIDHMPAILESGGPNAVLTVVAPGAFATMGVPFKSGRDFNDSDAYEAPFTAIINETLASISFPNEDPIGHLIFNGLDSLKPMKIVGVVGNIRQYGPAKEPSPEIFMAYQQHPQPATNLMVLVRTSVPPGSISPIIREKIRGLSPDVPAKFSTMEASLSETVAAPRFNRSCLVFSRGSRSASRLQEFTESCRTWWASGRTRLDCGWRWGRVLARFYGSFCGKRGAGRSWNRGLGSLVQRP